MDTQIVASPEAMLKLAGDTGELLKKIVRYNSDLSSKLDGLGSTFHDEGFDIIQKHIKTTRNTISESLPEFRVVLGKITEIANLYKQSQRVIDEKDGLNWAGRVLAVPAVAVGISSSAMGGKLPEPIIRPISSIPTPEIVVPEPVVKPVVSDLPLTPEIAVPQQDVKAPSVSSVNTTIPKKPVANNFLKTKQKWVVSRDGSKTFNTPLETGKGLNYNQGNAIEGFQGTCGLVSSANILKMAGIKTSEKEIIEYCSKNLNTNFFSGQFGDTLCTINGEPNENGGTTSIDRQQILAHYGVPSELQEQTVDNIATAVESGKGVIVSVDVKELWQTKTEGHHAIIVTSVKRDKSDNIVGFWVTDSGASAHEPATYYSKDIFDSALTEGKMNVTTNIIR